MSGPTNYWLVNYLVTDYWQDLPTSIPVVGLGTIVNPTITQITETLTFHNISADRVIEETSSIRTIERIN